MLTRMHFNLKKLQTMQQIIDTPQLPSWVDEEQADIPYSETIGQLHQHLARRGVTIPISHIRRRRPKFRKLFDRHIPAYRC